MEQVKKVIENAINQIQEQRSYKISELNEELKLIDDLGFSSLDIAQLIAYLEMELNVDPFSEGAMISSINTVGNLCKVYQECLNNKEMGKAENE